MSPAYSNGPQLGGEGRVSRASGSRAHAFLPRTWTVPWGGVHPLLRLRVIAIACCWASGLSLMAMLGQKGGGESPLIVSFNAGVAKRAVGQENL